MQSPFNRQQTIVQRRRIAFTRTRETGMALLQKKIADRVERQHRSRSERQQRGHHEACDDAAHDPAAQEPAFDLHGA